MESIEAADVRSTICETKPGGNDSGAGINGIMSVPPESGFTALLELLPAQAVELLVRSPESDTTPPTNFPEIEPQGNFYPGCPPPPPIFPSDMGLIERASKFSVFAGNSPETTSILSNSGQNPNFVKQEPLDSDSNPANQKSTKRKARENKVKESSKKSAQNTSENAEDASPYVHVRARRGQATDSHSLAERARREKINARMKLLQELVPGCNKISGTAMVLDEIINHVQYLQHQVEFLSMSLAAVNPRIDFDIDSLFPAETGSPIENNNFPSMITPPMWPEELGNGNRQPYHQALCHFDGLPQTVVWGRGEENSLLAYNSTNPASLHGNQLKTES